MLLCFSLLLVFFPPSTAANVPPSTPSALSSPIEKCLSQQPQPATTRLQTLEGLVGIGWDNLINVASTEVYEVTFDECRMTPDGAYLLPDNVIALPVQKTHFDQMAQYYDSYEAYRRKQSYSINVEASAGFSGLLSASFSGSYSSSNIETKQTMFEHKSTLLVSKMKHHAYTLHADPGGQLAPGFEFRLREVAEALMSNRTTTARYLAELIIRDYGTHVISSADVGVTIEREQHIDSTVKTANTSAFNEYRTAVSANVGYAGVFNAGAKTSWSKTVSEDTARSLSRQTKHVVVRTHGGPKAAATTKEEPDVFVIDNLVAFDFRGDYLFTNLHASKLRFHPHFDVVVDLLQNATKEYYARNEVRGCMDRKASNYNYNANVDDSSCISGSGNYSFGGFYSICRVIPAFFTPPARQCDGHNVPNMATGDFSCAVEFEPALILNSTIQLPDRHEKRHWGWFKALLHWSWTYDVVFQDRIEVRAYHCRPSPDRPQPPSTQEVLFGGLFNDGFPNQITNEFGCPGLFRQYPMFKTTKFCLSRDYQRDSKYAVQLQHIFSCHSPRKEQQCAVGFSQHLAFVHNDCEVYYCVRNEVFLEVIPRPVQRPPFVSPQSMSNLTVSSIIVYVDERMDAVVPLQQVVKKGRDLLMQSNAKILKGNASDDEINKAAMEHWMEDYYERRTKQLEAMEQAAEGKGGSNLIPMIGYILVGGLMGALIVAAIGGIVWKRRRRDAPFAPLGDDNPNDG